MLDEKAVSAGNITREVLKQTIKELLADAGIGCTPAVPTPIPTVSNNNTKVHFWGNKFHFLPANFEFPSTDPLSAWKLWWFGNETLGFPPLRRITSRDLSTRQKANTLSEWSMLMKRILIEIEAETGNAVSTIQSEQDTERLFAIGMNRLAVLPTISQRRHSQLKVTTDVRLMREADKASNPNARSIPYRKRKRRRLTDPTPTSPAVS